jgi:hypothetical protein
MKQTVGKTLMRGKAPNLVLICFFNLWMKIRITSYDQNQVFYELKKLKRIFDFLITWEKIQTSNELFVAFSLLILKQYLMSKCKNSRL